MFFELREYRIKGGQRGRFLRLMEETMIPFQISKGVVVVGSFIASEEEDLFVWIRRFESESERERIYKEIYESDFWKNEIIPQCDEMLDRERMRITKLEATGRSVIH